MGLRHRSRKSTEYSRLTDEQLVELIILKTLQLKRFAIKDLHLMFMVVWVFRFFGRTLDVYMTPSILNIPLFDKVIMKLVNSRLVNLDYKTYACQYEYRPLVAGSKRLEDFPETVVDAVGTYINLAFSRFMPYKNKGFLITTHIYLALFYIFLRDINEFSHSEAVSVLCSVGLLIPTKITLAWLITCYPKVSGLTKRKRQKVTYTKLEFQQ